MGTPTSFSISEANGESQQTSFPTAIAEMDGIADCFLPLPNQALPPLEAQLQAALEDAQDKLQDFAASRTRDELDLIFGEGWNRKAMRATLKEWRRGDFSNLPEVDLLTGAQLNGANGAYNSKADTAYLSSDFLLSHANQTSAVTDVILEEIGHATDRNVNAVDALGDEGDLFQRVVQDKAIAPDELAALKAEDDIGALQLGNRKFQVEYSISFTGTSDGTVNIRTGPGTGHSIVGTLSLNQRVTFDSVATGTTHWDARERINDNRWFRIQGTNNWVSAAFITGNPGGLPVAGTSAFSGTSDGTVNIRTGPGTGHSIAGTLSLNQRVTFDAVATGTTHWDARESINDNRWFRIQGTNNWVSAAFITGNPGSTTNPITKTPILTRMSLQYFRDRPQFYTSGNLFHTSGWGTRLLGGGWNRGNNGGVGTEGNCTWYVHGRIKELGGNVAALGTMLGNASLWDNQLSNGAHIVTTPRVGDIAQWESNHVAVVEAVHSDGTITISESHWNTNWDGSDIGTLHHVRRISASNPTRFIRVPGV